MMLTETRQVAEITGWSQDASVEWHRIGMKGCDWVRSGTGELQRKEAHGVDVSVSLM